MASPLWIFHKDPGAVLDYAIDWSEWLNGDTIATSTWAVPANITAASFSFAPGGLTIAWVSAGTNTVTFDLVNTITTLGGRTDARTLRFVITRK